MPAGVRAREWRTPLGVIGVFGRGRSSGTARGAGGETCDCVLRVLRHLPRVSAVFVQVTQATGVGIWPLGAAAARLATWRTSPKAHDESHEPRMGYARVANPTSLEWGADGTRVLSTETSTVT